MDKHDEGYNWLRNDGHTLFLFIPFSCVWKLILAQCILTELPTQEERPQDFLFFNQRQTSWCLRDFGTGLLCLKR